MYHRLHESIKPIGQRSIRFRDPNRSVREGPAAAAASATAIRCKPQMAGSRSAVGSPPEAT